MGNIIFVIVYSFNNKSIFLCCLYVLDYLKNMGKLRSIQKESVDRFQKHVEKSKTKHNSTIVPVKNSSRKTFISPKIHQERVVQHLSDDDNKGLIVFHGLGTGKTFTSIFAAESFLESNRKSKVIVILSASVKAQFVEQVGKIAKKKKRYEFYSRQEFVRREINMCSGNMIIIDEAHNLRNASGKITKAIVKCTDVASKVLLLTATPLVNSVHEIGSMIRLLSKRSRIPIKYNTFIDDFGEDGLKKISTIKKLLKDKISFYIQENDSVNFPSEKFHEVFVPMESRQCEIYDDVMSGKFSDKLEKVIGDPSEMSKALVFFQKPRQFCNIVRDGKTSYKPKIISLVSNVLKSIKNGGKCIIYSQYIDAGIEPIIDLLKPTGVKFMQIIGETSKEDKERAVRKYNSGKLDVILLSRSASEGLDLKETSQIHLLEPHFHMSTLRQVIGRGVRYKSHKDPDAVVNVFVYFATKCDSYTNTHKMHKTQSMDLILWYLNLKKQKIIDEFTDKVIVPSAIEGSKFSFIEQRKGVKHEKVEVRESQTKSKVLKKFKNGVSKSSDNDFWVN